MPWTLDPSPASSVNLSALLDHEMPPVTRLGGILARLRWQIEACSGSIFWLVNRLSREPRCGRTTKWCTQLVGRCGARGFCAIERGPRLLTAVSDVLATVEWGRPSRRGSRQSGRKSLERTKDEARQGERDATPLGGPPALFGRKTRGRPPGGPRV